jgi:dTDP-4-amino-4,6-dideoxygalactose transaminase
MFKDNTRFNHPTKPMHRRVSFLDLRVLDDAERRELLEAVDTVLRHGRIMMGPEMAELEGQLAARIGRRHAVAVNSGTEALYLGLKALGLKLGDEVITTALSWIATANAIALNGATPVFADIRDDLNLGPESVRRLITPRTKAILPVHYTGKVCEMAPLEAMAKQHGLALVEDGSQSFDARHHGRVSGAFGTLACISLNPMKVFAACGEAGVVLTDDDKLAERLIALRYNGTVNRETCIEPSVNGRLDTLQAAILLRRLPRVGALVSKRRENAAFYNRHLAGLVTVPVEQPGEEDVRYTYTIRSSRRDELKKHLEDSGVEIKIQHPLLMPEQPAYRATALGEWTNAKRLVREVMCLPVHEKLVQADLDHVVDRIKAFGPSLP